MNLIFYECFKKINFIIINYNTYLLKLNIYNSNNKIINYNKLPYNH